MIIFEGTAHFSNVSSPKYQRRRLRLPKENRSMASATCPLLFLGDLDLSSGLCHGHFDILGPACDRARTSNAIAYESAYSQRNLRLNFLHISSKLLLDLICLSITACLPPFV